MKHMLFAVLAATLFVPSAFAQAPAAERAFVRPTIDAAKKAVQELGPGYSFQDLYARVEKILADNAAAIKPAKDWAAEHAPWLAGSEEYAMSRRAEALMAGSARKNMEKRNQECLQAFKQAGETLLEKNITFNPQDPEHQHLLVLELKNNRLKAEQARSQRTKALIKMWMEGLQNSAMNMK